MKHLEYVKQMACCFSVLLVGRCGKIILGVSQGFEYLKGNPPQVLDTRVCDSQKSLFRFSFARISYRSKLPFILPYLHL